MKTVCIYHSIDLDGHKGAAGFRLTQDQFVSLIK